MAIVKGFQRTIEREPPGVEPRYTTRSWCLLPEETRMTALRKNSRRYARSLVACVCMLAALGSCRVRWIDSYSRESEESLLSTYGKVERLFDAMRQTVNESSSRDYTKFAPLYSEVHQAVQVQIMREGARPLNRESQGIVARIDTLFSKYREDHRKTNSFNPALLEIHRNNLRRLFEAALKAERVKADTPSGP